MNLLRKAWNWFDDRTGTSALVAPLLRHPVPPKTGWTYVFGSATLTALIVQVVTGIALAAAYVPSSGGAYESLRYITHTAPLGRILRGMHYFGASAMVLFIGVHMTRVFLTGAYKYPREMNWLTGSFLLLLTLAMGFTGQLLRWDQNAIWSVVVGAEQAGRVPFIGRYLAHFILGGETLGASTLSRFFSLHVFVFMGAIFLIVGLHLYLVIRNGISEPAKLGRPVDPSTYRRDYHALLKSEGVPFWPDAAWRDVVFATLLVLGVVILAWIFGPPALDRPPDPSLVNAQPRPDWYLLWYFAVLALLPHGLENGVIVLAPIVLVGGLLLLPFLSNRGARSPRERPWAVGGVLLVVLMIGTLWIAGIHANWSPDFAAKPLPPSVVGTTTGPTADGARLFHDKACIYCHAVEGHGGKRGPDLTEVGRRLTRDQIILQILNGGYNMPGYAGILRRGQVDTLVVFLLSSHGGAQAPPGSDALPR